MNLIVLDLDGTLTKSDNLVSYSFFMIRRKLQLRFLLFFPLILLLKIKIIDNVAFKKYYLVMILSNYSVEYLHGSAKEFVQTKTFQTSINQDVLNFIQEFKNADKMILSANYDFIVESVANVIGIEKYVGIEIHKKAGKITRNMAQIPYGNMKIDNYNEFVFGKGYDISIGLGDSQSDLPLLKFLDKGYLVKYSKKDNTTSFKLV